MSARSQSGARSAPSTARRGGPKVLWRPGSASHRVRPDDLISRRRLVADRRSASACGSANGCGPSTSVLSSVSAPESGVVDLALDDRIETAPRAAELGRPNGLGVAAKDASACNSMASNRSTIALTSAAPTMASPSTRACATAGGSSKSAAGAAALVTEKQFAIADLSPDEEMMVVEASYPLRGAETPRRPACGR